MPNVAYFMTDTTVTATAGVALAPHLISCVLYEVISLSRGLEAFCFLVDFYSRSFTCQILTILIC
jgi:hypothetical protein